MRNFSQIIAIILLLSFSIRGVFDYRAEILANSARDSWISAEAEIRHRDSLSGESAVVWTPRAHAALEAAISAASVVRAKADAHRLVASILQTKAEQETNVDDRLAQYCLSLNHLGLAIKQEPFDTSTLINWASTRQLLGGMECKEQYTSGDFRRVIDLALSAAPNSGNILFNAGLLSVWSGDSGRSVELFSKVLSFGMPLTPGQKKIVLDQIGSGADFEKMVPNRFPQIIEWSGLLKARRQPEFYEWQREVSTAQVKAIRSSLEDFDNRKIGGELYLKFLLGLSPYVVNTQVRKELDGALTKLAMSDKNTDLADYLKHRAHSSDIRILKAVIKGDTRPSVTPLARWGAGSEVSFDDFYQTIGFFVPRGPTPSLIELYPKEGNANLDLSSIEILVSDDNSTWDRVSQITPRRIIIGDSEFVGVRIDTNQHRYWKVHFANSSHNRTFSNDLERIIKVYGEEGEV